MTNNKHAKAICWMVSLLFWVGSQAVGQDATDAEYTASGNELTLYAGKYYELHTDLEGEGVLEAELRLRAMAECYQDRTEGFSGKIKTKLPFYLYSQRADYQAAAARPEQAPETVRSAGQYSSAQNQLLATVDTLDEDPLTSWRVVQHEGFHQFADVVISPGTDLPTWLNEGMAEYFAKGIWTGNSLVCGVVPDGRELTGGFDFLGELQELLQSGDPKPWPEMLAIDQTQWNAEMNWQNYLQAWSMVHFFAHGDDGKYRKALCKYIQLCSDGDDGTEAFAQCFGDLDKLEAAYETWWLNLKPAHSDQLYDQVTTETLMSHLSRYQSKNPKDTFDSAEDFFRAAREGTLALSSSDTPSHWLPDYQLESALEAAGDVEKWSLTYSPKATLSCTREDGTVISATYSGGSRTKPPNVLLELTEIYPIDWSDFPGKVPFNGRRFNSKESELTRRRDRKVTALQSKFDLDDETSMADYQVEVEALQAKYNEDIAEASASILAALDEEIVAAREDEDAALLTKLEEAKGVLEDHLSASDEVAVETPVERDDANSVTRDPIAPGQDLIPLSEDAGGLILDRIPPRGRRK